MADLQITYLLYFPKFIYCLFASHGSLSPAMTDNWSLRWGSPVDRKIDAKTAKKVNSDDERQRLTRPVRCEDTRPRACLFDHLVDQRELRSAPCPDHLPYFVSWRNSASRAVSSSG